MTELLTLLREAQKRQVLRINKESVDQVSLLLFQRKYLQVNEAEMEEVFAVMQFLDSVLRIDESEQKRLRRLVKHAARVFTFEDAIGK